MMNRSKFLRLGVSLATASAFGFRPDRANASEPISEKKMKRIGCTTACFRNLFPATRPKGSPVAGDAMTLERVPELFAQQLGVHNIELWSPSIEQKTPAYAQRIKRAVDDAGSVVTNLQLDGFPYNLSDPDADQRHKSIGLVKAWMEFAAACGATSARANTGGRKKDPFDLSVTADSYHQLARFGQEIGVKVLVENHGGHSANPENVIAIVKQVNSPWCRALPDFGNLPPDQSETFREPMLRKMYPYAHCVSAKGIWFGEDGLHAGYDIGECVRTGEQLGFQGIYSAEYYDPQKRPYDPFRVASLIIRDIAAAL